jgi:glycosyltransferase involved in cell wall biosynthesis
MIFQFNNYLVTIAIPTYNRANYLRDAIRSAVHQSYKNIEIIISNNNSIDDTESILKEFNDGRIRYFKQNKNISMPDNWNFCLEQAKGDFFLLLSDDDILEESAIKHLLDLYSNENVSLAYGPVLFVDKDLNKIGCSKKGEFFETGNSFIINSLKGKRAVLPCATLYKTNAAKQLGGFPDIGTATDFALCLMLSIRGNVVYCDNYIAQYRIHENCLSNDLDKIIQSCDKFVVWVNRENCILYNYQAEIIDYFRMLFFKIARSEALKNNKIFVFNKNKSICIKLRLSQKILLRIYNLMLVRKLAQLRKHTLKKIKTNIS